MLRLRPPRLLFGLFVLLGINNHARCSGASSISDTAAAAAADGSATCDKRPDSTADDNNNNNNNNNIDNVNVNVNEDDEEGSLYGCIADAERGLCESDPAAMFKRCSPDIYCSDRKDFGAFAVVDASVFRKADDADDYDDSDDVCRDLDEDCEAYADETSCLINPSFMRKNCRRSCYLCIENDEDSGSVKLPIGVKQTISSGVSDEAKKQMFYDLIAETASYMVGEVYSKEEFGDSRRDCRNTESECTWMVVSAASALTTATSSSSTTVDGSSSSSSSSYCEDLSVRLACGPACKACGDMVFSEEELETIDDCSPDFEKDAFVNAEDENGNKVEGEDVHKTIDAMFRRIVGELPYPSSSSSSPYPIVPGVNYTFNVLSRPSLNPDIHKNMPFESIGSHIGGPWIVVLDDFLTPEECDRMIELGDLVGRERSTIEDDDDEEDDEDGDEEDDDDGDEEDDGDGDGNGNKKADQDSTNETGEQEEDGSHETEERKEKAGEDGEEDTSKWRTSSTAWCEEECLDDPITQRIQRRIGLTTGVTDDSYYETLQLLKYVEGQYYKEHHDESGDVHEVRFDPDGPRILTFFLYLNDVEDGGETRFSDLMGDSTAVHIDVKPKKGRALLWPSMRNEDVLAYDDRTYHAALEVKKGVKYGANAWLHLRDFRNCDCDEYGIEELDEKLSIIMN